MTSKPITRVTLFKVLDRADQQKLIELYSAMPTKAVKDGQPYILEVTAGQAFEDQRTQGYTIVAVSKFANLDDMKYYDTECKAHQALRAFGKTVNQGFAVIYFENAV